MRPGVSRALPRGPLRWLLAAPLPVKLIGANALIVVAAAIALGWRGDAQPIDFVVVGAALLLGVVANVALTLLALRPLNRLGAIANDVWQGDLDARVGELPLADEQMRRLADTVDRLLDGLAADRERMRQLASQVIAAEDAERARIARELHDSTAQSLAALSFLLAAAARDAADVELKSRLEDAKVLTSGILDEVRGIAHGMHPRVLEDLGLVSALEGLARSTREHNGIEVSLDGERLLDVEVPRRVAGALYRVGQEALTNAARHAGASRVAMSLGVVNGRAVLEVVDDGRGFDVARAKEGRAGMGLFSMRERVALVHGDVTIDSAPGRGTRVVATVPLNGDGNDR
jgi:signal transduction histidine kinase